LSPGATFDLTGVSKATVCFVPNNPLATEVAFWLDGSYQGTDDTVPFCLDDEKDDQEHQVRVNGPHTIRVEVRIANEVVIEQLTISYSIIGGRN
jgi:hypothetical protein